MSRFSNYNRGFLTLLGLIASLVVVSIVFYFLFKAYLAPAYKNTEGAVSQGQGKGALDFKVIKETTKKIEDINRQRERQLNEFTNQAGQ